MKYLSPFGPALLVLSLVTGAGGAQPQKSRLKPIPSQLLVAHHPGNWKPGGAWQPLANQPTFVACGVVNPILLTDGTVLIQDGGCQDWWRLTPDNTGSYVNGTWSEIASLPNGYSPLYHSSAVLPDGRLIVEGGEYNFYQDAWTNLGAIYDPIANTWTAVVPPAGWNSIGDAQSVVLANGTYMQASCCNQQDALLDPKTLTWTPTGSNKFDSNDEEGWTLLPGGQVLTVDTYTYFDPYTPDGTNSEVYGPNSGAWQSAGSTVAQLWGSGVDCGGESKASFEIGPGVLRPDGTVFYAGANPCGAAHTAIYDTHKRSWQGGPDFPGTLGIADGPAAVEPNGNVLMMASPASGEQTSTFLEWDGHSLNEIAGPPNAIQDFSYYGNMLVLPSGQILFTDFSQDVEIYTPSGRPHPSWRPVVAFTPPLLHPGGSYQAFGLRFNGMSQGAAYGDDVQAATNYPLVRITNLESGHVFYSRTHDHSSMGVATSGIVSTHYDVPADQELGVSKLEVVANGIASDPVFLFVY